MTGVQVSRGVRLGSDNFSASWIEEEPPAVRSTVVSVMVIKIEHSDDLAASQHVERLRIADRPKVPVVLDEAQDGSRLANRKMILWWRQEF